MKQEDHSKRNTKTVKHINFKQEQKNDVAYLLKTRTVEPEKQPLTAV
jgi:hypothetical protein